MNLLDEFNAAVREVRDTVAALLPPEAVHRGWNLANLSCYIDEDRQHWRVDCIGPFEIIVDENEYMVPVPGLAYVATTKYAYTLRVVSGPCGTIETRTKDDLIQLASEWIGIVWPARRTSAPPPLREAVLWR